MVGLFAGIGGIELGLGRSGFHPELLCEYWAPARSVLERRFPGVPIVGDIEELRSLPPAEVVTAGFPCTDLSQAGMTAGIEGQQSGLVRKALSLMESAQGTMATPRERSEHAPASRRSGHACDNE